MLKRRKMKRTRWAEVLNERQQRKILDNRSVVMGFNKEFQDLRHDIRQLDSRKKPERERKEAIREFFENKGIDMEALAKINSESVSQLLMAYHERMLKVGEKKSPVQRGLTVKDEHFLLEEMRRFLIALDRAREAGIV